METMKWTNDFAVGDARIDSQHQELFRRINAFGEALWEGAGTKSLTDHLIFLEDYVVSHFASEESVMKENGYPLYPVHKEEHDRFIEDVASLRKKLAVGDLSSSVAADAFDRTCVWTRNHVKKMDRELGRFLGSR